MGRGQVSKLESIVEFRTPKEWEEWLAENHNRQEGVWMKFYKKGSGVESVTYAQALDEALCYGWIDGQAKSLDNQAYLQKFTPRRKKSMWSKRNTEHISRLSRLGKIKPAGLAEVDRAKADGRWAAAYESPANTKAPEDFLKILGKNRRAKDYWEKLNKSNSYAIIWQINGAKKAETRMRRIKKFVEMLARGEKLY